MPTSSTVHFGFRPWVRRAALSILAVALATTILFFVMASLEATRYGWIRERSLWIYLAFLWLGGVKVLTATFRDLAILAPDAIVLRPVHLFGERRITWDALRGTEQMIRGDRLIVYYDEGHGLRFVALNLNLVRDRRGFLTLLDDTLRELGFVERVIGRSRYLSRAKATA